MSPMRTLTLVLIGTAGACSWQHVALAADLIVDEPGVIVQPDTDLPAVSGINGKWEFEPGILNGGGLIRASGSLSVPLGDRFGLQGDGMVSWSQANGLVYAGAVHAFTRDPQSYLLGLTGGVVVSSEAMLSVIGGEGELYMDQVSFEAWAGLANLNYVNPVLIDKNGVFAIADAAFYPTDDTRIAIGGSYILGDLSVHASGEYLFRQFDAPLSLTADARYHADGAYTLTVGLKGYFGGNDDNKSLINRHRQDDPPDRALDLFGAAGDQLYDKPVVEEPTPPPTPTDQESCVVWAAYNFPGDTYIWVDGEGCIPGGS